MAEMRVRIRRGRRTDFMAVMQLLAASGAPVPPPDRATLRRFRHLVADLGADFYLALVDGALAGLLHVTYVRQLAAPPAARVEQLVVATVLRRGGIGASLLRFAQQRARQHGCGTLSCAPGDGAPAARPFLDQGGLTAHGALYSQGLGDGD
jgi:N-acetylglutamate synthase-like GNAT family acetyltransferase